MQRLFGFSLTLLLLATGSALGNDVQIRLNPSLKSPVTFSVSPDAPVVQNAITITNAGLAQQGWMRSKHPITFEGYLSSAQLSKNFEIELKSKVFSGNDLKGPAITIIEAGDNIELLAVEDTWSQIRIKKDMPVYFKLGETREPTPIYLPPVETYTPQTSSNTHFDPNLRVGTVNPGSLPPENVVWTSATNTPPPALPAESKPAATPIASTLSQIDTSDSSALSKVRPDGRIYRLSGTLIRGINQEAPRYALQLEDSNGAHIAYVDVSQMYIEDIRPYVNQLVYIHGEVQPIEPNSPNYAIIARTLRISQ
ncbi:MAG: hypothetical protein ACSHX8_03310 [Opitutaceae bacterium]